MIMMNYVTNDVTKKFTQIAANVDSLLQ